MAICPECKKDYKRLGMHWNSNPSHRPSLSKKQHEIIKGLMLGDGYIKRDSKNPRLIVGMTNKEYLEHLDDVFGVLSTGVKLEKEGRGNKKTEWRMRTTTHPELKQYAKWYDEEQGLKWPENFTFTPKILKTYYVSDGSLNTSQSHRRVTIGLPSKHDQKEKVKEYFRGCEAPLFSKWCTYQTKKGRIMCNMEWSVDGTTKFFEYIGEAPPGFEYKWL